MPLYEVADDKGRTLTIEGDSPPTEQELEELFASTGDELAGPKAVAPWMFQEPPSSLTPQSDFGMPESMRPAPLEFEGYPRMGPQTAVKPAIEQPVPEYHTREEYERLRASPELAGTVPRATPAQQAFWPAVTLPTAPGIEEAPVSPVEGFLAKAAMGPVATLLGTPASAQVMREAYNVGKGIPEFLTSPAGVATIPSGAVAPRTVAGVFGVDMLRNLLSQDEYLQANWDKMTGPERVRALTAMGVTGAMVGTLARHSLKPWKSRTLEQGETYPSRMGEPSTEPTLQPSTLGETYARTFSTPTTLHGDVRPRQASAPFLPVTQGSPGVRTEAERLAKEAPEEVSLTPEENSLVMSEAWSVDLPVKIVQRGERARTAASRRQIMGINFATGEIEVYPANLRVALEGIPEEARAEFIRSRLQGEQFHKSVFDSIGDEGAQSYWNNLTRVEQMLAAQIYFGRQNTTGFSPANLGHEVIRRRLQRLENGTPEEMVGVARTERWTLKSLQLLEDIIRKTRENVPTYGEEGFAIGTKAARANQELMSRLDRNLAAAREAITAAPDDEGSDVAETSAGNPDVEIWPAMVDTSAFKVGQPVSGGGTAGGTIVEIRPKELVIERPDGSRFVAVAEREIPLRRVSGDPDFPELRSKYAEPSEIQARLDEMAALQTARDAGMLDDPFDIARLKRLEKKYGQGPASTIRGELKSIEETPAESWSDRVKRSGFRDQTSWSYEMGRSITSEDIPALQEAKSKAAQESMRLLMAGKPSDMGMKSQFFGEAIRFRQALDAANERGVTSPEALAVIEREFGVGSMDGTELMRGLEAEMGPASVRRSFDPNPPTLSFKEWYEKFLALQRTMRPEDTLSERKAKLGPEFQSLIDDYPEHYEMLSAIKREGHEGFPRTGPGLGPASVRRGPMSKRGEDAAKLSALRAQMAEGTAEPAAEAASKLMSEAYEPVTPARAADEAKRFILESKDPSFEGFAESFRSKFGAIPSGQLRELFSENIGDALMAASGKRLGEILKQMGLVKNVVGGGKPGERILSRIPDIRAEKVESNPELRQMILSLELGESRQAAFTKLLKSKPKLSEKSRLRYRAIGEILYSLLKQSEGTGKSIARKEVTPEELASPMLAKEPVFADIRASELTDAERLGAQLTSDARTFNKPVSATKRLVTLLNRDSGAVDLVDIYLDPRRGAVVMSPTGAGAHQTLESVMKTHRPVHSILLDEPVQNFRKRYKSLREFNEEFGGAARERARASQYEEFTGEPVGEVEFEPGMVEGSGTLARPEFKPGKGVLETGAPLTDAEARATLEYVKSEVSKTGEVTSPEDVALAVEGFKDRIKMPVKDRPLQAISGIVKMVKSQMEQNKKLTEGEALEQVSRFIYETQSRTTPEQFVSLALANYRGRIAEAGEPVGPAPSPTARELTARTPGRIEGVGGGLASTMQRGAEVRQAAAEKTAVRGSRWIQRGALAKPVEESAFDRVIKETSRVAREAEAEVARDVPRREKETTEQWLERVREEVVRLEEFKAAQDQAKLEESIGPASVIRGGRNAVDAAEANMVNEFIIGPSKEFAEWYSGWLTQNIRNNGGAASSRAADIGDSVIDRTKQIYGKLTPMLDQALVLAGGTKEFPLLQQVPTPKQVAATVWLNRLSHPAGKDTAVSRTVDAIEGNISIPGFVSDTVNAARASNLEIGGLILEHPQGKFQRNMTAWGYDIMMKGHGPEFDAKVKADAALNVNPNEISRHFARTGNYDMAVSLERARVEADMRDLWAKWRAENLKPAPDINRIEKINQDMIRRWPKITTHVKTKFGYQQMIHTDLHNYLKNSALRTSHVAAFRERFPNTEEGRAEFAALDRKVRSELGVAKSKDWDALVKTLQGRPTDSYNRFGPLAPGTAWGEFTRALNDTAVSLARRAVLTGQMVTQLPETIVSPFVFFNPKNVLQSAVRFKELWPLMETTGQINKLTYDFSFDPANPIRSSFRFMGNIVSKAYFEHFLNEFQGKWFAANATVAVERMLAGKMSARELRDFRETLRQTGFTKEQVNRMVRGDAELLGQFQRRMPAWAVGENKLMAEGSRLGANRLFNSIFRFQMYPMLKMNQFRVAMGRVIEARQSGNRSEIAAANKRLAEMLFGTAIQGAMLSVLSAYAFGGPEGLEMKLRQAVDEPVDFTIESLLGAMSGPLYIVWSGARYGGWTGIGEQATRLAFPFSVGANLVEAAAGAGQYKDMDEWDRMGKFLSQKTPGYRIMKAMIAQWGLGQENLKLEANLKALAQWKRDRWKNKKFPEGPEYNRQFRTHMKKAVEALKNGDTETYLTSMKAAAGAVKPGSDPAQAIRDSFNARRVLRNPDTGADLNADETDDLKNRIGQDAYNRLEYLDLMLKTASLPGD